MSDQPQQLSYAPAPPASPKGLGPGIASAVLAILVPMTLAVTFPIGLFAALFTRGDYGSGGTLRWVMPAVMWGVPGLLALIAVITGITAVSLSKRWDAARVLGSIGLSLTALCVAGVLLLAHRSGTPLY
ncbi:hypothetical protein [Arthrobacter sp. CJ23]|uniref:hypothetical protein n=1 Tax=Arthrobacter sp. CJ23 TaxID=2972479 RepID=UPI00215C65C2|nr:hypothetical protein [Arthrobacter sp. CJ23]UVJ39125.1 hypothetical protein NVV90_18250 [Arthrobacter sp. CJ23]